MYSEETGYSVTPVEFTLRASKRTLTITSVKCGPVRLVGTFEDGTPIEVEPMDLQRAL